MTRGQRIQKLRTDASLSQEAFASLLGVSRQSVSKWEADKAFPEVDKLVIIAEKFGVSCDWIITGDEILEQEEQKEAPADSGKVTLTKGSYVALVCSTLVSVGAALCMCALLLYFTLA